MPGYTWHKEVAEKTLYITFDDGPIPVVTPFVLEQLKAYNANATFFCVGDNLSKHPDIAKLLLDEGHVLANHTYNHLKGWLTPLNKYLNNIKQCEQELERLQVKNRLFRPPYGRITGKQAAQLRKDGYELIMWDVLTNDYDNSLAPEVCLRKSIQYTENGSIIVFHDSLKAQRNLTYVLPRYLEHFAAQGYTFKAL